MQKKKNPFGKQFLVFSFQFFFNKIMTFSIK